MLEKCAVLPQESVFYRSIYCAEQSWKNAEALALAPRVTDPASPLLAVVNQKLGEESMLCRASV